jgi:hypothetical protein
VWTTLTATPAMIGGSNSPPTRGVTAKSQGNTMDTTQKTQTESIPSPKVAEVRDHRNVNLAGKAQSAFIVQEYEDTFVIKHSALYEEVRRTPRKRTCWATVPAGLSEAELNAKLEGTTVVRLVGLRKETIMSANQLGWYMRNRNDPTVVVPEHVEKQADGTETFIPAVTRGDQAESFLVNWENNATVIYPEKHANAGEPVLYKGLPKFQRFELQGGIHEGEIDMCEQDYLFLTGDVPVEEGESVLEELS